MEDEVTKHTKKIYKTIRNRDHSVGEKIREIIIEILIIVFAVSLSIWFHNWSEHRHEQREVKEFLRGLKDDLNKDIALFENNRKLIVQLDSNFNYLVSLRNPVGPSVPENEIAKHLFISIPVVHPNVGRYEGFKSSGKIGTIEDDSLKENILAYYQQTLPEFAYQENFINSLQLKILDALIERNEKLPLKDFLMTNKMQGFFGIAAHNLQISEKEYDESIAKAKAIISQIDLQH